MIIDNLLTTRTPYFVWEVFLSKINSSIQLHLSNGYIQYVCTIQFCLSTDVVTPRVSCPPALLHHNVQGGNLARYLDSDTLLNHLIMNINFAKKLILVLYIPRNFIKFIKISAMQFFKARAGGKPYKVVAFNLPISSPETCCFLIYQVKYFVIEILCGYFVIEFLLSFVLTGEMLRDLLVAPPSPAVVMTVD